jgi:hypothetical protein
MVLWLTGISLVSTTLNRRPENVVVKAIVIPKLELCDVKWHVFGAYLVERADDAALEDAPKTFNRLGVNGTNHVLPSRVVNGGMRIGFVEARTVGSARRSSRRAHHGENSEYDARWWARFA